MQNNAWYFVPGFDNLIVAVDHKPLLKLFGDRSLEDIHNPRLRHLKEETLRYQFKMVHVPGKKHRVADVICRHPIGEVMKMILSHYIASVKDDYLYSVMPVRSLEFLTIVNEIKDILYVDTITICEW